MTRVTCATVEATSRSVERPDRAITSAAIDNNSSTDEVAECRSTKGALDAGTAGLSPGIGAVAGVVAGMQVDPQLAPQQVRVAARPGRQHAVRCVTAGQ